MARHIAAANTPIFGSSWILPAELYWRPTPHDAFALLQKARLIKNQAQRPDRPASPARRSRTMSRNASASHRPRPQDRSLAPGAPIARRFLRFLHPAGLARPSAKKPVQEKNLLDAATRSCVNKGRIRDPSHPAATMPKAQAVVSIDAPKLSMISESAVTAWIQRSIKVATVMLGWERLRRRSSASD